MPISWTMIKTKKAIIFRDFHLWYIVGALKKRKLKEIFLSNLHRFHCNDRSFWKILLEVSDEEIERRSNKSLRETCTIRYFPWFLPCRWNISLLEIQPQAFTIIFQLDGIKVSLFEYPYPLLKEPDKITDLYLAHDKDIACMKTNTIAQRDSRKIYSIMVFDQHL